MLTESSDEDMLDARGLRECQEAEIALGHALTAAEHALAREAVTLGRTFERAGIAFDPLTFITLRIVEGSSNEYVDPVACLDPRDVCRGAARKRQLTLAETGPLAGLSKTATHLKWVVDMR